jgi:transposase-like protein
MEKEKKKKTKVYCAKCMAENKKSMATCVVIVDGISSPVCYECAQEFDNHLLDLLSKEQDEL